MDSLHIYMKFHINFRSSDFIYIYIYIRYRYIYIGVRVQGLMNIDGLMDIDGFTVIKKRSHQGDP